MSATSAGACPSENTLAEFAAGSLSPEQVSRLERHLSECAACCEIVDSFADVLGSGAVGPTLPKDAGESGARRESDDARASEARDRSAPGPSKAAGALHFDPGTAVGRYVILERIGAGAMGTVYAANDPVLDRKIAIKLVRPDAFSPSSGDQSAIEPRLLREAQALARLSNPHVIQVFDVGSIGGQLFIAMEFIAGGTLRDWLARAKVRGSNPSPRPSWREVLDVFRRVGNGLAAAHSAGLVHRDFKPDNVLVGDDGRVCVADFGLVRGANVRPEPHDPAGGDQALGATITRTGTIIGTPAYMAPEQLQGAVADARSDLFGFCVTFYEALYDQRPFLGETADEIARAALEGQVRAPPNGARVPAWLRRAVLLGLKARPAERPPSMDTLLAMLEEPRAARSTWTTVLIAAGVVLLIGGAGYLWSTAKGKEAEAVSAGGAPRTSAKMRRSIAVLGFRNASARPEVAWLSTALSEMLATELAAGQELRLIPGENIAEMKRDLALGEVDSFSKSTLDRIRAHLGTDLVVGGAYLAAGREGTKSIRLDLRLQDASTGETLAAIAETGSEDQIFDLVQRTGHRLRAQMSIGEISAAEQQRIQAAQPSNAKVARLLAEGIDKFRNGDFEESRALLEEAARLDPENPRIHLWLATAWGGGGSWHLEKEKEEIKRALDSSANLSLEERLGTEGRYRHTTMEFDRAMQIHRTLFDFFPDNIDYGINLLWDQVEAGKPKEALDTIAALRKLPGGSSLDPRIDFLEEQADMALLDFDAARRAIERAAERAKAAGRRGLWSRARTNLGWELLLQGRFREAVTILEEAADAGAALGDRGQRALALNWLGTALARRGDLERAVGAREEAIATYREIGNQTILVYVLKNTGDSLWRVGKVAEARARVEESVALARRIGHQVGLCEALQFLGDIELVVGRVSEAKRAYDEALAIALARPEERRNIAVSRVAVGRYHATTGALEEARRSWPSRQDRDSSQTRRMRAACSRRWRSRKAGLRKRSGRRERRRRSFLRTRRPMMKPWLGRFWRVLCSRKEGSRREKRASSAPINSPRPAKTSRFG